MFAAAPIRFDAGAAFEGCDPLESTDVPPAGPLPDAGLVKIVDALNRSLVDDWVGCPKRLLDWAVAPDGSFFSSCLPYDGVDTLPNMLFVGFTCCPSPAEDVPRVGPVGTAPPDGTVGVAPNKEPLVFDGAN